MATGYVRQSAASIVTGLTVEAAPINAELNALKNFASASTGHNHDGTTGGGAKIHLVNSVDTSTKLRLQEGGTNADLSGASTGAFIIKGASGLSYIANNYAGTTDPGVGDDSADGYSVGSQWVNTVDNEIFICVDATLGAAVWVELDAGTGIAAAIGAVKVTSADTTPSVLDSAILVSGALTKTVNNPGANETLTLGLAVATTSVVGAVELATDAEAQALASTSVVLTPSNLASVTATTTRTGIVELATDAEAQALTDTARAITPSNLAAVTATTTRTGIVELATTAEAVTGTDTVRAVTPDGLLLALKTATPEKAKIGLYTTVASGTTAATAYTRYRVTGTATVTLPTFAADEWIVVEFAAADGLTVTVGRNSQTIDGTAADDTCTTKGPIVVYYCNSAGAVITRLIGSVVI